MAVRDRPIDLPQPNEQQLAKRENHFEIARSLLWIFGTQNIDAIKKQLIEKIQRIFDQVAESFKEIHEQLLENNTEYNQNIFEKTREVIRKFFSIGSNDNDNFANLKEFAYRALPFPQDAIAKRYPPSEARFIASIESLRNEALKQLVETIKSAQDIRDDFKGDAIAGDFENEYEQSEYSQNRDLTWFCFSQGALVLKNKIYTFRDLVENWSYAGFWRRNCKKRLEQAMPLHFWVDSSIDYYNENFSALAKNHEAFSSYLIECSILSIESNLRISFSDSVKKRLRDLFINEEIRSDLSYFSKSRKLLYRIDLSNWNRKSQDLIQKLQLYFYLSRNFNLAKEEHSYLLDILLLHKRAIGVNQIPGFSNRSWNEQPEIEPASLNAFQSAWEGIKVIVSQAKRLDREISFHWDLLFFLMGNKRDDCIHLFQEIVQLKNFSVTVGEILDFFEANHLIIEPDFNQSFIEAHQAILKNCVDCPFPQFIFCVPAFQIPRIGVLGFGFAEERMQAFIKLLDSWGLRFGIQTYRLLGRYILNPRAAVFVLLEDLNAMGVKIDSKFLKEVSSSKYMEITLKSVDLREKAQQILSENILKYNLSCSQVFSIYQYLQAVCTNQDFHLNLDRSIRVVNTLIGICKDVSKDLITLIFLNPPRFIPEFNPFRLLRTSWINDSDKRSHFVIDQTSMNEIQHCAQVAADGIATACSEDWEMQRNIFQRAHEVFLISCLPTTQPRIDHLKIQDFNEDGPVIEHHLRSHIGQLKPILQEADQASYYNWSAIHNMPIIFSSMFNKRTGNAHSYFLSFDVELDLIKNRKAFFGLLSELSKKVMSEEVLSVPENASEDIEHLTRYFSAEEIVEKYRAILNANEIQYIWRILKELKVKQRQVHISSLEETFPKINDESWIQIAAQGNIYSANDTMALIPGLNDAQYPEYFTSNLTEENYETLQKWMSESFSKTQTDIQLKTSIGNFPLSIEVQTYEEIMEEELDSLHLLEGTNVFVFFSASDLVIPVQYSIECFDDQDLFKRYVNFQCLSLKALLYYRHINFL